MHVTCRALSRDMLACNQLLVMGACRCRWSGCPGEVAGGHWWPLLWWLWEWAWPPLEVGCG